MKFWVNEAMFEDVDTVQYPHAVELTDQQAAQIEAGTHVVIDGAVVPRPVHVPTLEEVKQETLYRFEEWRNLLLSVGVQCVVDATATPVETDHFDASVEARNTITSAATLCNTALITGQAAVIPTRSMTGVRRDMSAQQYAAFAVSYGTAWAALWSLFDDKREQIEACTTIEELEGIDFEGVGV
jgi:hypothetical protein